MNRLLFSILLLVFTATAFAQNQKPATKTTAKTVVSPKQAVVKPIVAKPPVVEEKVHIQWLTVAEAAEKMKTQKRKIFVDVYTDWCGWCKKMEQTTFEDKAVVKYISENYYAVRFDAEQKEDIVWNGKTYKFKSVGNRGYHELAAEWMGGRMSYPTTVYIEDDYSLIQAIPGFLEADKFEAILNYFGSNAHKKTPWESYEKNFVSNRH